MLELKGFSLESTLEWEGRYERGHNRYQLQRKGMRVVAIQSTALKRSRKHSLPYFNMGRAVLEQVVFMERARGN